MPLLGINVFVVQSRGYTAAYLLTLKHVLCQNEKAAEVINDLVQINHDRIEGYTKAIKETQDEDSDLKQTFEHHDTGKRPV